MRRASWVAGYAIAMGMVEAAVVVYLRALHPAPASVAALLAETPGRLVPIEVGREAATLVMLVAVSWLAGEGRRRRLLYFSLAFGVWDIAYYAWLWVLIGWPPSPLTWDVLFLIPVPWVAPVLAPLLVSALLVGGALWQLERLARGWTRPPPSWRVWALAGVGVALVLLSFMLDARAVVERAVPPGFRWWLFGPGLALMAAAGRRGSLTPPAGR